MNVNSVIIWNVFYNHLEYLHSWLGFFISQKWHTVSENDPTTTSHILELLLHCSPWNNVANKTTKINRKYTWVCLLFYVLATPKTIRGWVPTCDNAYSSQPFSVAPLVEDEATSTMT